MFQPMGSTVFIIPSDVIKSSGIINAVDPLASAYNLYLIHVYPTHLSLHNYIAAAVRPRAYRLPKGRGGHVSRTGLMHMARFKGGSRICYI